MKKTKKDGLNLSKATIFLIGFVLLATGAWAVTTITDTGITTTGTFTGNLSWSNLTGVPAGFADGVDNTGGAPDPNSTTLAWANITSIPAGFADGTDDVGAGNVSWNQSFANTLYTPITWNYNQTTPAQSYADATFAAIIWGYNQTAAANTYTDAQGFLTTVAPNSTTLAWDNVTSIPAGFADGVDNEGSGGNASWNESYADTLYTPILWNYNQTTPAQDYGDATFLTLADQRYNETTTLNSVNTTANIEALNFVQGAHTAVPGNIAFLNDTADFTKNISVATNNRVCLNGNTCTKYIEYNGTDIVIQG